MAILAYDDVMLREPRLLVPGIPPLGKVKRSEFGNAIGLLDGIWANGTPVLSSLSGISWGVQSGGELLPAFAQPWPATNHTSDCVTGTSEPFKKINLANFTFLWLVNRRASSSSGVWQCGTTANYWVSQTGMSSSGSGVNVDDDSVNTGLAAGIVGLAAWAWIAVTGDAAQTEVFRSENNTNALVSRATGAAKNAVNLNGIVYVGGGSIPGATSYHSAFDFACLWGFNRRLPLTILNAIAADPYALVTPA